MATARLRHQLAAAAAVFLLSSIVHAVDPRPLRTADTPPGWSESLTPFPSNPGNQAPSRQLATKPVAAEPPQPRWRILQNPNGPHTAMFFDPARLVFAVYHIDPNTGQITLKSVRSLTADLQLQQYGTSKPSPQEIQQMLDEAP